MARFTSAPSTGNSIGWTWRRSSLRLTLRSRSLPLGSQYGNTSELRLKPRENERTEDHSSHCMIYLVDNTVDGQGASPREIQAGLQRIRPDLEVVVEPFHEVTLARVRSLSPSHIILSGQSHPWDDYSPESLDGVFELIR